MTFSCAHCGTIDNTACAPGYRYGQELPQCTACLTGGWHGEFPRRTYDRDADGPLGPGRLVDSEFYGLFPEQDDDEQIREAA